MHKHLRALNLRSASGLSLLEIMVAIAVATVAMTALVVISNTAIRGVDTARGRTTADQYVREGVEQMRAYRDANSFATLTSGLVANTDKYYSINGSGTPIAQPTTVMPDACSAVASAGTLYQIPNNPNYYRIVTQRLSGTEVLITVKVCYDRRNTIWQSATAQTLLTNWK